MNGQALRARRLGIDTYTEPVVLLRVDSPVTRAEGSRPAPRSRSPASGAGRIVTCNTVPHETNAIDLDPALAAAVSEVLR